MLEKLDEEDKKYLDCFICERCKPCLIKKYDLAKDIIYFSFLMPLNNQVVIDFAVDCALGQSTFVAIERRCKCLVWASIPFNTILSGYCLFEILIDRSGGSDFETCKNVIDNLFKKYKLANNIMFNCLPYGHERLNDKKESKLISTLKNYFKKPTVKKIKEISADDVSQFRNNIIERIDAKTLQYFPRIKVPKHFVNYKEFGGIDCEKYNETKCLMKNLLENDKNALRKNFELHKMVFSDKFVPCPESEHYRIDKQKAKVAATKESKLPYAKDVPKKKNGLLNQSIRCCPENVTEKESNRSSKSSCLVNTPEKINENKEKLNKLKKIKKEDTFQPIEIPENKNKTSTQGLAALEIRPTSQNRTSFKNDSDKDLVEGDEEPGNEYSHNQVLSGLRDPDNKSGSSNPDNKSDKCTIEKDNIDKAGIDKDLVECGEEEHENEYSHNQVLSGLRDPDNKSGSSNPDNKSDKCTIEKDNIDKAGIDKDLVEVVEEEHENEYSHNQVLSGLRDPDNLTTSECSETSSTDLKMSTLLLTDLATLEDSSRYDLYTNINVNNSQFNIKNSLAYVNWEIKLKRTIERYLKINIF